MQNAFEQHQMTLLPAIHLTLIIQYTISLCHATLRMFGSRTALAPTRVVKVVGTSLKTAISKGWPVWIFCLI